MNKVIAIIIVVIVVFATLVSSYSPKSVENSTEVKRPETVEESVVATNVETSGGTYESYAPEKIAKAETGKVVLFFHASWCPTCRALNSDIEANISKIPNGTTVLKTDYDTETELKKKYGVTTQHTLVQVDKDGNMITKWSGGSKLENLLAKIQ